VLQRGPLRFEAREDFLERFFLWMNRDADVGALDDELERFQTLLTATAGSRMPWRLVTRSAMAIASWTTSFRAADSSSMRERSVRRGLSGRRWSWKILALFGQGLLFAGFGAFFVALVPCLPSNRRAGLRRGRRA
jgi:hypothetical protein